MYIYEKLFFPRNAASSTYSNHHRSKSARIVESIENTVRDEPCYTECLHSICHVRAFAHNPHQPAIGRPLYGRSEKNMLTHLPESTLACKNVSQKTAQRNT